MAVANRTAAKLVDLLAQLEHAPHQFDFYQALRLLECAAPDRPRLGESSQAKDDPVRLGQEPSLAFAPRSIHALAASPGNTPPRLEVLFFGLFGPNGPLPLHLTEFARDRLRLHSDPTFARFADLFHHRLASLFYRAWANAQPTVNLDRPETDRFATVVGSLAGLATPAMRHRDAVPDHAKLYFAGLLSAGPRNPDGLRAMFEEFFGLPIRIDEFVGRWIEIPAECRCELVNPTPSAVLGVTATIGSHIWDCQQTFRMVLGPVGLQDYLRLLPGGDSLPKLVDLARNYVGDELAWELRVILRKDQAPPIRLGEAGHLGLTAWLEPEGLACDADDFHWNPQDDGELLQEVYVTNDLARLHGRPITASYRTVSSTR